MESCWTARHDFKSLIDDAGKFRRASEVTYRRRERRLSAEGIIGFDQSGERKTRAGG